jgi:phage-related tail protein
MRTRLILAGLLILLGTAGLKAQFVVTDPINLAQGIVNSVNEIVQTSSTVSNVIKNFQEVKKVYQQGKEYYDKLKAVHDLVKDAYKVQQTLLMIGEISDIYVNSFELMLQDEYYTAEELEAIAFGYTKLLEEGAATLKEMKDVISSTGLSMTDKERMDIVDRCYNSVKHYRNLTRYYTNKNISISLIRAEQEGDKARILALYGNAEDRYW